MKVQISDSFKFFLVLMLVTYTIVFSAVLIDSNISQADKIERYNKEIQKHAETLPAVNPEAEFLYK